MTANTENERSNYAIKRKSIGNARNRTCQTHRRATKKIFNKKNSYPERNPIKSRVKITEKLLTTADKSNIIKFKLDEGLLQRRIYFLT